MPTAVGWPALAWPSRAWRRQALAVVLAVALHALALAALLAHWQPSTPAEPQVRTLSTRLIQLPPPAPSVPEVQAPPPVTEPSKPVEASKPDPQVRQRELEQAALARKRLEEQRQRERLEQAQRERQREERERLEREAQAREQAQARQREEQQRLQAEAAARADASRPYLPIAKEAPEYPDRALDKGIEGDCTVSYTVTPDGRVENPKVIGECHPLFVRPSLAAARTFRYQPRIVDGRAVAVPDVKNTFHYRIE
ncbi:energy transducer TonB [Pseudomonas indica]|uniref:Protein TonB n=1 Tax=Pseudomonas indica TaxID=137658 RepID=A0A1G9PTE6_9PSED|nr:energy transducer TonB [Pseudomonas indica]SDM02054.1 protein TonB [Pseudomonas indica]